MKDKDIVSNDLINDIFYKIPEIHIHHTVLHIHQIEDHPRDNKSNSIDLFYSHLRLSVYLTKSKMIID
jgi:hypothetical protein